MRNIGASGSPMIPASISSVGSTSFLLPLHDLGEMLAKGIDVLYDHRPRPNL